MSAKRSHGVTCDTDLSAIGNHRYVSGDWSGRKGKIVIPWHNIISCFGASGEGECDCSTEENSKEDEEEETPCSLQGFSAMDEGITASSVYVNSCPHYSFDRSTLLTSEKCQFALFCVTGWDISKLDQATERFQQRRHSNVFLSSSKSNRVANVIQVCLLSVGMKSFQCVDIIRRRSSLTLKEREAYHICVPLQGCYLISL